ncbi:MAG: PEP-CTERM sorting domain-containing protein [Armatimonadota bacterium]
MKAYSWYNGVLVDNGIPITNITKLTGWTISLSRDAASGSVGDIAWIDNFAIDVQIIPEPGSIAALATGLIGLVGLARRRS